MWNGPAASSHWLLLVLGVRVHGYDLAAADEPLSRAMVAAVEAVVATLPGLDELISLADVSVEYGQALVW